MHIEIEGSFNGAWPKRTLENSLRRKSQTFGIGIDTWQGNANASANGGFMQKQSSINA